MGFTPCGQRPIRHPRARALPLPLELRALRRKYRPHPEELAKQASRRMAATQGLAAILRDARKSALLRMRSALAPQISLVAPRHNFIRSDVGIERIEILGAADAAQRKAPGG